MLGSELHLRAVDVMGDVPRTANQEGRDTLLEGLPKNIVRGLNRYAQCDIDLSKLITQLDSLGRLEETGIRPLIIFIGNVLKTVEGTSTGRVLKDIIQQIECLDEEDNLSLSLPETPEALIFGGSDERLPYEFFEKAVRIQQSVGRLLGPRIFNSVQDSKFMVGTGWLVTPGLLFTNYHVIDARKRERGEQAASAAECHAQAQHTTVWFGYYIEGGPRVECQCIEQVCSNPDLDYALVHLESAQLLANRPFLTIARQQLLCRADRLNIVQYPGGGPIKYAVRNNFYIGTGNTSDFIRYLTDMEGVSSGSPVFNDDWQIVAMHRAAREIPPKTYKGETIKYHNEGIDIHSILTHLPLEIQQEIRAVQGG